jgi:hypothetical protein
MGAKQKLNSIHATTALIVAAAIGGAAQSWGVFAVALAAMLLAGYPSERCTFQPPRAALSTAVHKELGLSPVVPSGFRLRRRKEALQFRFAPL